MIKGIHHLSITVLRGDVNLGPASDPNLLIERYDLVMVCIRKHRNYVDGLE